MTPTIIRVKEFCKIGPRSHLAAAAALAEQPVQVTLLRVPETSANQSPSWGQMTNQRTHQLANTTTGMKARVTAASQTSTLSGLWTTRMISSQM